MKELLDLIHVLKTVLRFTDSQWQNFELKLKAQELKLFNKLRLEDCEDEELISTELFDLGPSSSIYRRIRRKLRRKLLLEIIQFDPSINSYTSFQRAYYNSQYLYAAYSILKGLDYSNLAKNLADQLLNKSREYHLNIIRADVSQYLSRYYKIKELDISRSELLHQESLASNEYVRLEILAENYYSEILSSFIGNKSNKKDVSSLAYKYHLDLTTYVKQQIPSYRFYVCYFRLACFAAEGVGDYAKLLNCSKAGLAYFENLSYNNKSAKVIFLIRITTAYLQLGKLRQAKLNISRSLKLLIPGRNNWFMAKRLLVQILIHEKDYESAYNNFSELIGHRTFKNQGNDKQKVQRIFGAYLDFLALVGKIPSVEKPKRFRINRFINEVPDFDADKRGMKIPLIVAQLLYYIHDRNYDAIENRILALKDYCSRNLRRDSANFRSNCFIKMLLLIPVNFFNPVAVRRKAQKYYRRLELVPFKISESPAEVEIIPYEDLWEIVLEHLSAPKRKRKNPMDISSFEIK